MRKILLFFCNRRGVASIEFALTVLLFIFMVLFIAEMSRMAYVSAVIDLAVSEGAKEGKNANDKTSGGYEARFTKHLTEGGGALWFFLNKEDAVSINVTYSNSVTDMIATGGQAGTAEDNALARYQLIYHYHPMFFPFPKSWAGQMFNREVIFVQEYERTQFMD